LGYQVVPFDAEKLDKDTFSMGTFLIDFLLGACRHRHQSRPFTLDNQTYKVCLDCGMEIGYSLESMAPLRLRSNASVRLQALEDHSRRCTKANSPGAWQG
jgi:hypothetical protein